MLDTLPDPVPTPTVLRISKAEEGNGSGDGWALLRAAAYLAGGIVLLGLIIT